MTTPARHHLHLVTAPRRDLSGLLADIDSAFEGGVDCVQVRDKSASATTLLAQAREVLDRANRSGGRVVVNDRLDVALAAGTHGVHLAGQSLPVEAAVQLSQGRLVVGRSVHSLSEAVAAARSGAGYVTFGHVFPTTSHPGVPPRGLDELRAIVDALDIPVLAIGGITSANIASVLATGCAGIAVISAILGHPRPAHAAAELRAALDSSACTPRHPLMSLSRETAASLPAGLTA